MNILFYLFILVVGAIVGGKAKLKESFAKKISSIQNLALYFLLFIMGIKIGLDKEIIYSFGTIGMQGILLALLSIIFSVLGVSIVAKTIFVEKEQVSHDN